MTDQRRQSGMLGPMRAGTFGGIAALLLLLAAPLAAQPRDSVGAANEEGKRLFAAGKLEDAARVWRAAFFNACGPEEMSLAKNLGIAFYKLQHPAEAYAFFAHARTVDRYGVSQLTSREKVELAMADLDKALQESHGLLEVEATPTPNALACLPAAATGGEGDGEVCYKTPLRRYLPPGKHRLRVVRSGQEELLTITIEAGQRHRQVVAVRVGGSGGRTLQAVETMAGGGFHTCALDTTGGIRCWGDNRGGQVGDGTCEWYQLDPSQPLENLGSRVLALAVGSSHTCALQQDGSIACWGRNSNGQLGMGHGGPESPDVHVPEPVEGLDGPATALALGYEHSCALLDGGEVACWGQNYFGQLGLGMERYDQPFRDRPEKVPGLAETSRRIAAGGYHTCVLSATGKVYCWGDNRHGQLGDGTDVERPSPVAVKGLPGAVREVVAGGFHTCAVTEAGQVYCWGQNRWGQVGDGSQVDRTEAVHVAGLRGAAAALALGQEHTCARMADGSVECWGSNAIGQLGIGGGESSPTPRRVDLAMPVAGLAAGGHHTCGWAERGSWSCWGQNYYGQLGDGTRRDRERPPRQ
jgi:alpha-tubulin suppressor-like RCC1 family protein